MLPQNTPILIAGAGPTGLALAIMLQQADVPHMLIERATERSDLSRAAVVHAHTLEALDRLGVVEDLAQNGLVLDRFTFRDRGQELARIEFGTLPSKFAHLLMIPQNRTEEILEQRLNTLGGKVWRGVDLLGIEQDAGGANATILCAGQRSQIRANFVVGADGMHSVVRDAAGIAFEGSRLAESFALGDVVMDWPEQRGEVSLYLSRHGMLVVAPLPDGRFRLVAATDGSPEAPTVEFMQNIIDERGPSDRRVVIKKLEWSSRFHIHHRLAQSYRKDCLFLMGDAAHVHSPAGGQGMNTGLVDAVTLGQLLIEVVGNGASEALLEFYGQFRRPAAAQVLKLAGRLTMIATIRSPILRTIRNVALRTIGHTQRAKTVLAMNLSGTARRHFAPYLHAPLG